MELTQKTQVCAVEQAHVIHTVAHHDQPVQPDVDVEPGEFIGVKSCRAQYVGVRCAAGRGK